MRICRLGYATALTLVLTWAPLASGATFVVNNGTDAVDANPGDGVCAISGSGCTLRAAVQEANALAGADTISVPVSLNFLTILGGGEDAGATGDLDITGDLTILGIPAPPPTNTPCTSCTALLYYPVGSGNDRIFDVHSGNVVLSDIYLSGGHAPAGEDGGNIRVTGGSLTLIRSGLGSSTAAQNGGSLSIAPAVTCTATDSRITGGSAGANGGGIYGHCNLSETTVSGNSALQGGGLYGFFAMTGGSLGGSATGDGGGLFATGATSLMRVTVSGSAFASGGGILADTGSTVTLRNVTVTGAKARTDGGGIKVRASATATLNNVTLTADTADDDNNGSGNGGGVSVAGGGSLSLGNTILAQNVDKGTEVPDGDGTVASTGYNLIGSTAGLTITGDGTGNLVGVDPQFQLFGPLLLGGRLFANSPAIQAGNPALPGSGGAACESDDILAIVRPQGPRCDIGAYESEEYCGDGTVEHDEECDAGGAPSGVCDTSCHFIGLFKDVDWYGVSTCLGSGYDSFNANGPWGQTFTPSEPVLGAVSVGMAQSSPPTQATVTVNIRDGSLAGTLLATTTRFVNLTSPTQSELFRFAPIARLTPGATYAIELIADAPGVVLREFSESTNPPFLCDYPGGTMYGYGGPYDSDLVFKTFSTCGNGTREPGESCDDGNAIDGDGCDSDCLFTVESIALVSGAGGTVSTDTGGGASANDPVETSVTTPNAGLVSIQEGATAPPPTGYTVIGQHVAITAPVASAATPLHFVFQLDATLIPPGTLPADVVLFRNQVAVANCTGAPGVALPDPCVDSRTVLGGGDLRLSVLTSAASVWTAGIESFCGNAVVELGESCDDGDTDDGDGCDSSCIPEAGWTCPEEGQPCEAVCGDGLVVATEQCDDGNLADGDCCTSSCELPVCAPAGRSVLVIHDNADDSQDKLVWKWLDGTTGVAAFGSPTSSTGFTLCIRDEGALAMRADISGGGLCGNQSCWKSKGPIGSPTGFQYKSAVPNMNGATGLILKSGTGTAKAVWKGKGVDLPLPAPFSATQYFNASSPVLVQLVAKDGAGCWQSDLPLVKKNTATRFKAVK